METAMLVLGALLLLLSTEPTAHAQDAKVVPSLAAAEQLLARARYVTLRGSFVRDDPFRLPNSPIEGESFSAELDVLKRRVVVRTYKGSLVGEPSGLKREYLVGSTWKTVPVEGWAGRLSAAFGLWSRLTSLRGEPVDPRAHHPQLLLRGSASYHRIPPGEQLPGVEVYVGMPGFIPASSPPTRALREIVVVDGKHWMVVSVSELRVFDANHEPVDARDVPVPTTVHPH